MKLLGVFLLVFYGVGIAMLASSLWAAWRSSQAGSWPTTPGTLTNVELHEEHDEGTTYEVRVTYIYAVAGQEYQGSRLAYGYGGSSGCDAHRQILNVLESGKHIDVRYNPLDPAEATLSFGFHRSIRFALMFSITWLAFVAGFTAIAWTATQADTVLIQNLSVH